MLHATAVVVVPTVQQYVLPKNNTSQSWLHEVKAYSLGKCIYTQAHLELPGTVPEEGSLDVLRDGSHAGLHEVLVLRVRGLITLGASDKETRATNSGVVRRLTVLTVSPMPRNVTRPV